MERKPKDIHEVLGELRRRITELSIGDYSKGYRDELSTVNAYIEDYPPNKIILYLSPLLKQLKEIQEDVFQKVSDDPHEEINQLVEQGIEVDPTQYRNETGESPRDLMRKEVQNYISRIAFYIKNYRDFVTPVISVDTTDKTSKLNVLKYSKYSTDPDRLKDLHGDLSNYIYNISIRDFKIIFSGIEQLIKSPIDWRGNRRELRFFLKGLYSHDNIDGDGQINWFAVKNCFRYKGEIIEGVTFKSHNSIPANSEIFTKIVSKL